MKFNIISSIIILFFLSSCSIVFKDNISKNSANIEYPKMIGNNYIEKKLYKKAEMVFTELIENNPNDADSYYKLGFIYHKIGKINKSLKNYLKVISIDPAYSKAYYNLGAIYSIEGNFYDVNKASFFFKRYLAIEPESQYKESIQNWLIKHKKIASKKNIKKQADYYFRQGDLLESKKLFEQCIPKDKEINYKLGIIYRKMGLTKKSIGQFFKVIEEDKKIKKPYYPVAFYYLGKIYAKKGNYYDPDKSQYYLNKYRYFVPGAKSKIKHEKKIVKNEVIKIQQPDLKPMDKNWIEKQTQLITGQKNSSLKTTSESNESNFTTNNIMDKDWIKEQIDSMNF